MEHNNKFTYEELLCLQNITTVILKESDLDKGVPVSWKFKILRCEGDARNMVVGLNFLGQGTRSFYPDENGQFEVDSIMIRGSLSQGPYYTADVYFGDLVGFKTPEPLHFPLWLPKVESGQ